MQWLEDYFQSIPGFKELYYSLAESFRFTGEPGLASHYYGKYIEACHAQRFSQAAHSPQIAMAHSRQADMQREQIEFVGEKTALAEAVKEVPKWKKSLAIVKADLKTERSAGELENSARVMRVKERITYLSENLNVWTQKLQQARAALSVEASKKHFRIEEAILGYRAAEEEWSYLEGYSTNVGVALYHKARLLEKKGSLSEAKEAYGKAMAILEELLPADDLRIAALARGYAGLLGEQSNWLESLKRRLQANRIIGAYKARQAPAGGEDAKT